MAGETDQKVAKQNQLIAKNIRAFGWHCLHVLPTEDGEDQFCYSIGFSQTYSAPEIIVFGLTQEKAHALLSHCADLLEKGHVLRPDVEDSAVLAGGYSVVFRPLRADCFAEYLGTAIRYYQDKEFAAMVMFLPDRLHRFPWQAGYDYIPADEALSVVQAVGTNQNEPRP